MKVSTKGGNQRPDGTVPSADAMSVIEWATVNAVITIINERILRQGNIRQPKKIEVQKNIQIEKFEDLIKLAEKEKEIELKYDKTK